ncbi:MAG: hypothetical protein II796_03155 [Oscillospiraceae bacterium]|nr:hypothetical protein [Oscillospiraceae bacterium]
MLALSIAAGKADLASSIAFNLSILSSSAFEGFVGSGSRPVAAAISLGL